MEQNQKPRKNVPHVSTNLREDIVLVPTAIRDASGIRILGKRIKSIIFTTDVAIALNNDADAILAVYPFTPHPAVVHALTSIANVPVFAGVGGAITQGNRSATMALFAEAQGCVAVVVNAPTPLQTIREVEEMVHCPIVYTVVSEFTDLDERIEAGVDIFNISGGKKTPQIVKHVRERYPDIPIIATGGPTNETVRAAIDAGANAITYTPPSNGELFRAKMELYREKEEIVYMDTHDDPPFASN